MKWTRREFVAAGAGSLLGMLARAEPPAAPRSRMGVVLYSYSIRRSAYKEHRFDDPLTFLEYCHSLGAGGVQTGLGVRDEAAADRLRAAVETHKLYLEATINLPRDQD